MSKMKYENKSRIYCLLHKQGCKQNLLFLASRPKSKLLTEFTAEGSAPHVHLQWGILCPAQFSCFKSWLPSPVMSILHPYKGVLQHSHQHSQKSPSDPESYPATPPPPSRDSTAPFGESYLPAVTSFLFPCLSQHASSSGSKGRPDATASMQGGDKSNRDSLHCAPR